MQIIAFFLALLFLEPVYADASSCDESYGHELALLDHHLVSASQLVKMRKAILDRKIPGGEKLIDDYVDLLLLNDVGEITLKEAFKEQYALDATAKKLYTRNAENIIREFCRYRPNDIYSPYFPAIKILFDDCRANGCNYCDPLEGKVIAPQ